MASDLNSVALIGRLTRDPELRGSSGSVLSIRLAFTSSKKNGDEWEDVPGYIDVVTFGRSAESLSKLLERGDQIAIDGRIAWREYETKDGEKRQTVEIVANRIQLLAKPKGKEASPAAPAPKEPAAELPPPLDDDIPF